MPTYDYVCKECGDKFEHFQTMMSPVLTQKPGCEKKNCRVKRMVSGGSGLIFKGSGFYLTDYKNKGTTDIGEKESTENPTTKKESSKSSKEKKTGKGNS
jgi:putative FmdB family regulatory protein